MSPKQLFLLLFSLIVLGALSACTDSAVQVAPDSISGRVKNIPTDWSGMTVNIYAAQFNGNATGEGYYVLEPDRYPQAQLQTNGSFVITAVPEGTYILLVGPTPEEALRLLDRDAQALILDKTAEVGIALGDVFVLD